VKHSDRILPALLSFLAPGLGQLYQGKLILSVVFFASFMVCLWLKPGPYALGLAVLVGVQTFWNKKSEIQKPYGVYAGFGILIFLIWVWTWLPFWSPSYAKMIWLQDKENFKHRIETCKVKLGKYPENLDHCPGMKIQKDLWGTLYQYQKTSNGYEYRSAGIDKQWNTQDDMVFTFPQP